MHYFLGADLGGTKTHMVISDETGCVVGFGEGGPANHQNVGFDGMFNSMNSALEQALHTSGISIENILGAGFGIAGYDWPSEKPSMLAAVNRLKINAPIEMVNDAIPGLVAGADAGWGVNVVSGTGCNCRGWDKDHQHIGRVTGYGILMGEAAGSSELVFRAMQLVGDEWTRRGEPTLLSKTFIDLCGAKSLEDLIEGYTEGYFSIGAETAPLIFQTANDGDKTAKNLITWAGNELGEMAKSVIRQLNFKDLTFDVILSGSMFEGGDLLINPMRENIQQLAPHANLKRLSVPPVIGSVLIGMEQAGCKIEQSIRKSLAASIDKIKNLS
ncbi:MAG: BadF/BadG/BcrA/BcrD ATPase family protein [Chloroflexota bacterium]